ncbi:MULTISPECIES: helix-turn-helix transcriptional regulator [unclassified Arenimonas]|uniref:helix-turn-helix transcriptional regulator n=1 Tax=unclassified Arenimonas TaxID=2641713 RepID=UPI0025BEE763|nr:MULTISPECIES: helix-turn-helix transcriptional regulator [unclassified Arenimonas]
MKSKGTSTITSRGQRTTRHLAGLIQRARLVRNMTQADLAERARVSPGSIHRLERAEPGVALWVWLNAMEALGQLELIESLRDPLTEALAAEAAPKRAGSSRIPDLDF